MQLKLLKILTLVILLSACGIFNRPPSQSEPLPKVYITCPPIESKDVYVQGTFKLDSFSFPLQIKGRGNSTWIQPKKPYKIKFNDKQSLFGMPADKEWALLANYLDKSLLRNDVAFELSDRIGLPWTPRRKFVDLYLNGQYDGNYLLTETVKASKDRLNIQLMDSKKPNDTTSSFITEADYRLDAIQTWTTPAGVRMDMKDPEEVSPIQFEYIRGKFAAMETAIGSLSDVRSKINLDIWIKWIIVNELMRNRDGIMFGSCYFYKDTTNRIAMGPVWDFDLSAGSYHSNDPEGWYINTAAWIGGMFLYHPVYKTRFKEIWNGNRSKLASITSYIKTKSNYLQQSQIANYKRWPVINNVTFDGQFVAGSYDNEVKLLINFLEKRFLWMDGEVQKF